jgi:hypothetical protein
LSESYETAVEQEMLVHLNDLRQSGTPCSGSPREFSQPLSMSPSLACAARVHSLTAFFGEAVLEPERFPIVRRVSDPPETLDLPAFVQQVVDEGGEDCLTLLSSEFNYVGIGYSSDWFQGYWTFYLGTA